jgi:RNA polymerase sigma factor (sigma-70 family)
VPHHLLTVANKIKKKIQEYEYQFFRSPTLAELSQTLQISEDKILSVIKITQAPISIQAKMGSGEDDDTLEYYLSDKKNLTPEEAAIEKEKGDSVRAAIERLPERLGYIIKNFYGFTDEEKSLAEIGRELGVSRERSRQLLRQALQKLQDDKDTWHLQSFID